MNFPYERDDLHTLAAWPSDLDEWRWLANWSIWRSDHQLKTHELSFFPVFISTRIIANLLEQIEMDKKGPGQASHSLALHIATQRHAYFIS